MQCKDGMLGTVEEVPMTIRLWPTMSLDFFLDLLECSTQMPVNGGMFSSLRGLGFCLCVGSGFARWFENFI
jgi:hypothetical protein